MVVTRGGGHGFNDEHKGHLMKQRIIAAIPHVAFALTVMVVLVHMT